MRKLLIVLLVLVILGLTAPFGLGWYGERQIKRLVDHIPATSNVQVSIENYSRRWFTSNAQFKILLRTMKRAADKQVLPKEITLLANTEIKHGPIMWDTQQRTLVFGAALFNSAATLTPEAQQTLTENFKGEIAPLHVRSVLRYSGALKSQLSSPAFSLTNKQLGGGTFVWQGLKAHSYIARKGNKIKGQVQLAGLSANKAGEQIQLSGLNVTYKERKAKSGLWVGEGQIDVPSFVINTRGQERLNLKNLSITSKSQAKDNLFNATSRAKLEQLQLEQTPYGPGEYAMQIRNLNADALAKLKQQLATAQHPGLSRQQRQAMLLGAIPLWPLLLDKGPIVELQTFNLMTPDGKVSAEGSLKIPQDDARTQATGQADPQSLLKQVDAVMNINLPVTVAEKMLMHMYLGAYQREQTMARLIYEQQLKQQQDAQKSEDKSDKKKVAPKAPQQLSTEELQSRAQQATEQQLKRWVENQLLIVNGDTYKIQITFKDQQLLINGQDPKRLKSAPPSQSAAQTNKPAAKAE